MRYTCSKCNTVKRGDCPIFKPEVTKNPSFGRIPTDMLETTIFAVIDTCGCKFMDVNNEE